MLSIRVLYFACCLPMSFVNSSGASSSLGIERVLIKAAFKSDPFGSNDVWETEDLLLQQLEQSWLFYCGLRCQHSHVHYARDKRAYTTAAVHSHLSGNSRICLVS